MTPATKPDPDTVAPSSTINTHSLSTMDTKSSVNTNGSTVTDTNVVSSHNISVCQPSEGEVVPSTTNVALPSYVNVVPGQNRNVAPLTNGDNAQSPDVSVAHHSQVTKAAVVNADMAAWSYVNVKSLTSNDVVPLANVET